MDVEFMHVQVLKMEIRTLKAALKKAHESRLEILAKLAEEFRAKAEEHRLKSRSTQDDDTAIHFSATSAAFGICARRIEEELTK